MLCSLSCSGCEAKDLLPLLFKGSQAPKQFWIALWCSGADPSAPRKPCRNTSQFAWLASGWRVAGVRWIASREVCSGYSNSGNALGAQKAHFRASGAWAIRNHSDFHCLRGQRNTAFFARRRGGLVHNESVMHCHTSMKAAALCGSSSISPPHSAAPRAGLRQSGIKPFFCLPGIYASARATRVGNMPGYYQPSR